MQFLVPPPWSCTSGWNHRSHPLRQSTASSLNYKWWVFGTIAIGTFMSVVTHSGVAIALPSIGTHFDADLPTVQWVSIAGVLAVSALLLPAGRLSDIVGRKQVYIVGLAIFALASGLAGLSPSLLLLILALVLQGVGSAMIQANGMAMIISVFPSSERGKALGSHLSVVGAGAILGPPLAGLLVTAFDWPAIFFVNIPLAFVAIAVSTRILDNARITQQPEGGTRPRFDWVGASLSAGTLLAFLLAMTNGNRAGWESPAILAGMVTAAALLAAFVWWELRTSSPLLDLRLFQRPVFALGVFSGWIAFVGMVGGFFLMPIYFQSVLGYSPREAGLFLIPGALCMTIIGPVSGRLSDRLGWRKLTVSGMALSAVSLFILFTRISEEPSLALIVAMLTLQMIGIGIFITPNASSILSTVERHRYGVVSALTQLMRNSAMVTGIALVTAIVVATMASMGAEPSLKAVSAEPDAFVEGIRRTFLVLGSLTVVGIIMSLLKTERPRATLEPSPQGSLSDSLPD